jgi:replicative DNA helicase
MKLSAPVYRLKRQAKLLSRTENIPLHEALDRVARAEGFAAWSLLAARYATTSPSRAVLSRLAAGDLLLLGARPGHGKTLLGLQLLLDGAREGRRGVFFTLEYTEREARARIRTLEDAAGDGDAIEIVTSDEISADYVIRHLRDAARGTLAIIDYLQILDQQRSKPPLAEQMRALRAFAERSGVVFGLISQIDRSFDPAIRAVPDMRDIRLPNVVNPEVFSKACFLHDGEVRFQDRV